MAKKESIQKRLQKVRPPRVQMTYDVEIGDAIESKELPFVMGVAGDLGGSSAIEKPRLKDRKFVSIDSENFDEVMKGIEPARRPPIASLTNLAIKAVSLRLISNSNPWKTSVPSPWCSK